MSRRTGRAVTAALAATALLGIGPAALAHPDHDGSGKEVGFDTVVESPSPGGVPMERMSDVRCEDGMADIFPCHKVDLASFVPLSEMDSVWSNDMWGWTDEQTGREYAVIGLYEGTGFVDVTDPYDPTYLGRLPAHADGSVWRDVKVVNDHAYVVSEAADSGMQVFDMTRLRGATGEQTWTEDAWLGGFGHAHNIAMNADTDHVYVVGARRNVTACDNGGGGPIMVDVSSPTAPEISGCFASDGYTHDVQCVVYHGPDADYTGREICIGSNEDTVTIFDATDKTDPVQLARLPYDGAAYTHQGWLTEDHRFFLLGDELDELTGSATSTTTYIWDMEDLDNVVLEGIHESGNPSIDHNIWIKDGIAYESNYTSGLRLMDTYKVEQGRLKERGYFDVFPVDDHTGFAGTWGNYPFFDSGTVAVSGTEEGLFVLKPRVKSSDPGYNYPGNG